MEPYRDQLPTIELTVQVATNVSYRYKLTDRELSKERVDKPGSATTVALGDATLVQLATLAGTTFIAVHAGGKKVEVSSGLEPLAKGSDAERQYFHLLEAISERVAMISPNAKFLAGSWAGVVGVGVCSAIAAIALAVLSQTSFRSDGRFPIAVVLVALGVFVGVPIAFFRARPKPFDPRKLPRVYDPLGGR